MQNYLKKLEIKILGAACILFCSCSHFSLPPMEYSRWVQDSNNGLCTSQVSGNYLFKLQYKPHEYMALMNSSEKKPSKTQFQKNISELGDMYYLTLSISSKDLTNEMLRTDLNSPDEYFERLNYFTFQFKKDLYLLDGKDSIPCVFAHFERSFTLSPNSNFLLAFPKRQSDNIKEHKKRQPPRNQVLVYRDKILNTGDVSLSLTLPVETKMPLVKL